MIESTGSEQCEGVAPLGGHRVGHRVDLHWGAWSDTVTGELVCGGGDTVVGCRVLETRVRIVLENYVSLTIF